MRLLLPYIALLGALLTAAPAAAEVAGLAEWRYGEFRGRQDGAGLKEASHFTQRYSLMYHKGGQLAGGRGGRYNIDLGYMWTAVDSETDGESFDIGTGKVLFRGEMQLAPGGLPFRLRLYSQDLSETTLTEDNGLYQIFGQKDAGIPVAGMVNNLANGQRIRSGGTLIVGIRNGSYQGRYRDVLSQFPRLLVDYQEYYVRDLKSRTPQHSRSRDLAFVSLNKKDNWFHYRLHDYHDFLNASQDFSEKSVMLGTVDHELVRQWINLTNWIQLSVDGTYTVLEQARVDAPAVQRYDLNLFGTARRSNWNASNFSTFSRVLDGNSLEKRLEVPFFLQGEIDRNTAWRFRMVGSRRQHLTFASAGTTDFDDLFASARLETFRTGRFVVAPELAAEVKGGDEGEGNAVRAGFEIYSNRAHRPRYELFGAYSLARFAGTGVEGFEVDYWEQEAKGRLALNVTARLRAGLTQELLYGSGSLERTVTHQLAPRGDLGLTLADARVAQDGAVWRSTTGAFVEYTHSRFSNRFELRYDYLSNPAGSNDLTTLSQHLRYGRQAFDVTSENEFVLGAHAPGGNVEAGSLRAGSSERSFSHKTTLRYTPSRLWDGGARVGLEWQDEDAGASTRWDVQQNVRYHIYKVNGIVRRLASLREEAHFERFRNAQGGSEQEASLLLGADYFPTRVLNLSVATQYRRQLPEETDTVALFLSAGLDFQKLKVALDYSYGTRSAGEVAAKRTEQRWELTVKKIF